MASALTLAALQSYEDRNTILQVQRDFNGEEYLTAIKKSQVGVWAWIKIKFGCGSASLNKVANFMNSAKGQSLFQTFAGDQTADGYLGLSRLEKAIKRRNENAWFCFRKVILFHENIIFKALDKWNWQNDDNLNKFMQTETDAERIGFVTRISSYGYSPGQKNPVIHTVAYFASPNQVRTVMRAAASSSTPHIRAVMDCFFTRHKKDPAIYLPMIKTAWLCLSERERIDFFKLTFQPTGHPIRDVVNQFNELRELHLDDFITLKDELNLPQQFVDLCTSLIPTRDALQRQYDAIDEDDMPRG